MADFRGLHMKSTLPLKLLMANIRGLHNILDEKKSALPFRLSQTAGQGFLLC